LYCNKEYSSEINPKIKAMYDPYHAPDPEEWLELTEDERINQVLAWHMNIENVDFEGLHMHCMIHNVIETQVAMADEIPVKETLERLMDEGLDRHDAIHAAGSVLAKHLWKISKGEIKSKDDPNQEYYDELKELTVQKWFDETSDL
jgi:hypothetical protein